MEMGFGRALAKHAVDSDSLSWMGCNPAGSFRVRIDSASSNVIDAKNTFIAEPSKSRMASTIMDHPATLDHIFPNFIRQIIKGHALEHMPCQHGDFQLAATEIWLILLGEFSHDSLLEPWISFGSSISQNHAKPINGLFHTVSAMSVSNNKDDKLGPGQLADALYSMGDIPGLRRESIR
jgi:hypothetical protein